MKKKSLLTSGICILALLVGTTAYAEIDSETKYVFDTFAFLVYGFLVMWMAAGFSMLEAGLVRSKNTAEILTKNIGLFAIACTMYMVYGYDLMYGGGLLLDGISGEGETYSNAADFYVLVVFVATSMSYCSGSVADRM